MFFVQFINRALNKGKVVVRDFLDPKKAFDTVSHSILPSKLYAFEIRGSLHRWFQSYMSNRFYLIFYGISNSERNGISCEVSQRSIPGLLLFIIRNIIYLLCIEYMWLIAQIVQIYYVLLSFVLVKRLLYVIVLITFLYNHYRLDLYIIHHILQQ